MAESILRDDIEYVVHCDEKGKIIGPLSKIHAHLPGPRQTLTHYSTWAMMFHPQSRKYGIQFKNPKKYDKYGAGKWDTSVGGHNCYAQDNGVYRPMNFKETLIKEADEEIGLNLTVADSVPEFVKLAQQSLKNPLAFIFEQFHYKTEHNNEFVGVALVITPTMKVEFRDEEVVEFKWLTPPELEKYLKTEKNYCHPLLLAFEKAEKFRKRYFSKWKGE